MAGNGNTVAAAVNRHIDAFRRLLATAANGGQARTDAVVALCQRTVIVPTWSGENESFRTLVNSAGTTALPIFTGEDELAEASRRFGWGTGEATSPSREVGAREALRYAAANDIRFVVVDITAAHSLELEQSEITPLLAAPPLRSVPREAWGTEGTGTREIVRVLAAVGTTVDPPAKPPSDALVTSLSEVLRGYPEVEWAAFCQVARDGSGAVPTVAIRIGGNFRARVPEICAGLQGAMQPHGEAMNVLPIEDPELTRAVRARALPFYPWRRK